MWEQIGSYSLRWPSIALDRSPWRCDATPSSGLELAPDGVGYRFTGDRDRLLINRTDTGPWLKLGGIRIETRVRLTNHAGYLFDGGDSFKAYLGGDLLHFFTSSYQNTAFVYLPGLLETLIGQWHKLTFVHNGLNQVQVLLDDRVVASEVARVPVPSPGPQGVCIGNSLTQDKQLFGDIDDVSIWRIDPKSMNKAFFKRPLSPEIADCWTKFFRALREWARGNPECASWVVNWLTTYRAVFQQALAHKSPQKLKELADLHQEYGSLWRAGRIDDPQMKSVLKRLRAWLIAEGLLVPDPRWATPLTEHPCVRDLLANLPSLTCDPQTTALIQALMADAEDTNSAPARSNPNVT
jgi:hypothetical protein